MKKILLILSLFVTTVINAQLLDTTWVRDITMNAGDWAYLTGKSVAKEQDSIMIAGTRRLRDVVQANIPATFNTPVTVDSISGRAMIEFYKILLFAPFAEIRQRGLPIFNAITGEANLAPFIAEIDASTGDLFIKERTRGKNYLLDD